MSATIIVVRKNAAISSDFFREIRKYNKDILGYNNNFRRYDKAILEYKAPVFRQMLCATKFLVSLKT